MMAVSILTRSNAITCFAVFLCLLSQTQATAECGYIANPMRLPPSLYPPATQPPFDAPPSYWIWGNWKMRFSSRPQYHQLPNLQVDQYGIMPNATSPYGLETDLVSFSNPANSSDKTTIITAFGYDHPLPDVGPIVFQYFGSGRLNISTNWELVAWGYDSNGVGFRAEYEYQVPYMGYPPSLNVLSREETGIDAQTWLQLQRELAEKFSCDKGLTAMLKNVTAVPIDGRRSGQLPVNCGEACIENLGPLA